MDVSGTDEKQAEEKLPLSHKLCCGAGHVLNDLYRQMAFSFELVFYIKVVGLSGGQTGFLMLYGQVVDGVTGPFVGYCGDRVTLPLISRLLGKRKAWHLLGVILMAIFFPLEFTRCFVCDESSQQWAKVAYYLVITTCISIAFPAMDIGHLSIISVVAKNQEEAVELNVLRTLFTYASGICAYGVTWIVLGQDSEGGLTKDSWKDFTLINCILVGIGILFSGVIFHTGTKEPKDALPRRKVSNLLTKFGLVSAALVFRLGSDVKEDEEYEDPIIIAGVKRKLSFPLRKTSAYVPQFDETKDDPRSRSVSPDIHDTGDTQGADRKTSVVRKASSSSRKLSTVRKISAYIVPFDTGMVEHHSDDEDGKRKSRTSRNEQLPPQEEDSEQQSKEEGMFAAQADKDDNEAAAAKSKQKKEARKSSFPTKIVDACHVVETQNDVRSPKTRTSWLKDLRLYKVSAIYSITRLIQDAGYTYMAFYLTDHLLFHKEAIAFFPLILLVSGLFGTTIAKLLNKKLGGKWTYCLAAALVIGSAAWFYFLTHSTKSVTYAPTIIIGGGMSAMFVMALNFITDLIGENRETSGFVCSVAGFIAKLTSGLFFLVVQDFYPANSDHEDCMECGPFARHVFTLSLGILSLLGLLIVMVFQKSTDKVRKRTLQEATDAVVTQPLEFQQVLE